MEWLKLLELMKKTLGKDLLNDPVLQAQMERLKDEHRASLVLEVMEQQQKELEKHLRDQMNQQMLYAPRQAGKTAMAQMAQAQAAAAPPPPKTPDIFQKYMDMMALGIGNPSPEKAARQFMEEMLGSPPKSEPEETVMEFSLEE